MEIRISRASAVVVQRVPPDAVNWFLEWQNGITAVAETAAGYQGTDVYPPTEGQADEWVAVIHFTDDKSLQQWLGSPVRAQWVEKLRGRLGEFNLKMMPGGFSFWFAGLGRSPEEVPPGWKMVLAVLVGLYPIAMLQTFGRPYLAPLGLPASMLLDCLVSVSLLQWVVMPGVRVVLSPWLKANARHNRALSLGGLCLILLLLAGLMGFFRLLIG